MADILSFSFPVKATGMLTALAIIHTSRFQREVGQHSEASISLTDQDITKTWGGSPTGPHRSGLLSCLPSLIYRGSVSDLSTTTDANVGEHLLLRSSVNCLLLGDYNEPQRHVEALLLYAQYKHASDLDPVGKFWTLLGGHRSTCYVYGLPLGC
jgi:hypothetical protein